MSSIVIDNFISDFDSLRKHCDDVDFKGETNPVDNVFYPGVSTDIPTYIKEQVKKSIETSLGERIKINAIFMRLSPEGVIAPHQAHTDATMGDTAMMLYLNNIDDCLGGTSFVMHKASGMKSNPINQKQQNIWERDTNMTNAWQVLDICEMLPNRALIFDSKLMHRSEPVGGFGKDSKDGRLVLTAFFDWVQDD